MLRLALASPQGHDRGLGCDCNELPAGRICGVPIRFSIYLVFYGLYSAMGPAHHYKHAPWWVMVGVILGGFFLLILTILVHEFGHGLTARYFGGQILYILLWPLGGLCFHTMPQHHSVMEKLTKDWWVTFNGPCTHLFMIPCWVAISALVYNAFELRYSIADVRADLDPWNAAGSLVRHPDAAEQGGWLAVLMLQLCATAISLNVLLFLFNIFFPMYPMDCSKLLVTGMQLCGTPVEKAARRFILVSGACAFLLLALAAWQLYHWVLHSSHADYERAMQMINLGMVPLPLSVLLSLGLGCWGGKQTCELNQLAKAKRLHQHPLFCHVNRTSRMVRDLANGRPDLFVEEHIDRYDDDEPFPGLPLAGAIQAPRTYGAVRIVAGRIVRD